MFWHYALPPLCASVRVIHHQAKLDHQRTSLRGFVEHFQKFQWRIEQARKSLENWNGCGEWLDEMRCVHDHTVAFLHRFAHETKLSILKITNSTVCHVRGRRART